MHGSNDQQPTGVQHYKSTVDVRPPPLWAAASTAPHEPSPSVTRHPQKHKASFPRPPLAFCPSPSWVKPWQKTHQVMAGPHRRLHRPAGPHRSGCRGNGMRLLVSFIQLPGEKRFGLARRRKSSRRFGRCCCRRPTRRNFRRSRESRGHHDEPCASRAAGGSSPLRGWCRRPRDTWCRLS